MFELLLLRFNVGVLTGAQVGGRKKGSWNRPWHWTKRNPSFGGLAASVVLRLSMMTVAAVLARWDTAEVKEGAVLSTPPIFGHPK